MLSTTVENPSDTHTQIVKSVVAQITILQII